MDLGTGFPIDLILFGMIAAFLVLRLRSVLGRRTGFERPPPRAQPLRPPAPAARPGPVIEGRAEPVAAAAAPVERPVPDPASPVGQALARIQAMDRQFDPSRFLTGAETAFRMIVGAFAAGDRGQLRRLVADEVYRAFDQAIAAREKSGQTQVSEIRTVHTAAIEDAELSGSAAKLTVRFVSDQTSFVKDQSGNLVSGTEALTELVDIWTFERDLTAADPGWRLTAVRGG
jgi:predicted lipid-binding transport protein (Tim44 family)